VIDVANTISLYLQSNWVESNPGTVDLAFTTLYPGFNPHKGYPQISIDEILDSKVTATFVTNGVYRVDHEILVTVTAKPLHFTNTAIDATEVTFRNVMTEIDRILNEGRYSVSDINHVTLTGWKWEVDREAQIVVFIGKQLLRCTYYI